MADIRDRVKEDRGILKTIQMYIPGFRGYRIREDLRDSDRMLRAQMSKLLKAQRQGMEESRELVQDFTSPQLDNIGRVINNFKKIERAVEHADVGYSGISADVRIKEDEINRLYEFDASLIDDINAMSWGVQRLKTALDNGDKSEAEMEIKAVKSALSQFDTTFKKRKLVITGTEVSE